MVNEMIFGNNGLVAVGLTSAREGMLKVLSNCSKFHSDRHEFHMTVKLP